MIYLETKSNDPHFNLAFEEYILRFKLKGNYLILWQNRDSVIVGRNQNAYEEANFSYLEERGIDLVRRQTGGGAVFHDLGNLNYSFITDWEDGENRSFSEFSRPVVSALKKLGLDAKPSGRNDILIGDKKISGTAMRVEKNRVLHHGTLLFDTDPLKIAGALKTDPLKFSSKAIKSVKSRVGNISDFLTEPMTLKTFWGYLLKELSGDDFEMGELSQEDLKTIVEIKAERYDKKEWNFGKSPEFSFKNKRKFDGGVLEINYLAKNAKFEDIEFLGDFMALRPVEEVSSILLGVNILKEDIKSALIGLKYPLSHYFGEISIEEITETILSAEEKY